MVKFFDFESSSEDDASTSIHSSYATLFDDDL